QTLARDAQLSGDRVAAENFQQHSEHYARMLAEAQREIAERQSQQEAQNQRHGSQNSGQNTQDSGEQPPVAANAPQPEIVERPAETPLDVVEPEGNADLVETPEAEPKPKRTRARRPAKAAADQPSDGPSEPQPAVE
ncbi:MAG: DUF4167 domain-containing protein, partial [Pseudomonadota bacterium]